MCTKKKNGFLIVDAACCLPVFLIAVATLLFLIAQCGVEETVHHALIQSARCSSRVFCLSDDRENNPIGASGAFISNWQSILNSEWEDEQPELFIERLTFYENVVLPGKNISIDHVSRANVAVENMIPLLKVIVDNPFSVKRIVYRPFVGESEQSTFYDMTRVYVFPKRGERYHMASCSILKSGGVEVVLTERLRREKEPCQICNPQELPNGANVYIVNEDSMIYHQKSCPTITKSYVCMSRSEAISKGYTPCQICTGGDL